MNGEKYIRSINDPTTRVISWGIGGKLKVDKMVIIDQSRIRLVFDDSSTLDLVAIENGTLEIQSFHADGTYEHSEPVDVGWAGHA